MKRKVFNVLFALALVLSFSLVTAVPAVAATISVPGDYLTIQAAINAAFDGDTIVVAAGTYPELISINKGVAVQGAGVGSSIIDASGSAAVGNVVSITNASGDVLFDGFTVKTGTSTNGIYEKSLSTGTVTISHNKIEGFGPANTGDNFGLIAGYGSNASLVFTYNELGNCGDNTILLERHYGPTDVSYNTFDRTSQLTASDAYFNMNYGGTAIATLQKVSHNTIDMGAGSDGTNATRGTGISFAGSYTPPGGMGQFTNVQITDNTIYNLKPYRRGIGLWNATGSGSNGDIIGAVIAGNTITGPGSAAATQSAGIQLIGLITNTEMIGNTITGVDWSIRERSWNGGVASGGNAHFNEFVNNGLGLVNEGTSVLDATLNWWGDITGPLDILDTDGLNQENPGGLGGNVSEYVRYDPWIGQGGMVTGGGWIMSPPGAYTANPDLEGKATFGFVSMYKKGAKVPTGNTEFNFQVADLNFHSSAYDWLVIAGNKAMYKGTGTINGAGSFGFMLSAIDGTPDKFRIKIWDKDAADNVVYDNHMDALDDADPTTVIGGGQIVIHKK
ncbi:MAG: hypothetical protein KJ624_03775 [Chloroflexi bacterium]|nr:hypothetical protein [Chloroflexota bacterium]